MDALSLISMQPAEQNPKTPAALEALPGLLRNAKGERAIRMFARDDAEREMEAATKRGGKRA